MNGESQSPSVYKLAIKRGIRSATGEPRARNKRSARVGCRSRFVALIKGDSNPLWRDPRRPGRLLIPSAFNSEENVMTLHPN